MSGKFSVKIFFALVALALFFAPVALAHGNFEAAESLVAQHVPCDQLNETQLEQIGDYLMELRHPGEAHEWMDARMGGEGSESLRQMHLQLAKVWYCGQADASSLGVFGMMPGAGVMGGDSGNLFAQGAGGYGGMMGNFGGGFGGWSVNGILWTLLLAGGVIAVFLLVVRLWRDVTRPAKKR